MRRRGKRGLEMVWVGGVYSFDLRDRSESILTFVVEFGGMTEGVCGLWIGRRVS